MFNEITNINVKNGKIELLLRRECPYEEITLTKEEAIELAGQIYEMAESIPDENIGKKYNPEKDSKLKFQREFLNQIVIDIRNDDGEIVKKFLKRVNRDSRLKNLIGNKDSNFAL